MVTQAGDFRRTSEQKLLNFFFVTPDTFGMWLGHRMTYQLGLIKMMGEYVPARRGRWRCRWQCDGWCATELARDSAGALVPARVGEARASEDYSVVCSTVYNRARRNLSKMLNARCRKKHIEDARGQNIEDARCRNIENTRCRNIEDARVANRKPKEAVWLVLYLFPAFV